MLPSELRKKLDKPLFSGKDAKTNLNLSEKTYLGELKTIGVVLWFYFKQLFGQGKFGDRVKTSLTNFTFSTCQFCLLSYVLKQQCWELLRPCWQLCANILVSRATRLNLQRSRPRDQETTGSGDENGVQMAATTPINVRNCGASWEGYNP